MKRRVAQGCQTSDDSHRVIQREIDRREDNRRKTMTAERNEQHDIGNSTRCDDDVQLEMTPVTLQAIVESIAQHLLADVQAAPRSERAVIIDRNLPKYIDHFLQCSLDCAPDWDPSGWKNCPAT